MHHVQQVKFHDVFAISAKYFSAGGLIQGKAYGNIFNFADALHVHQPPVVGGQVLLYNSPEDPANLSLAAMKVSAMMLLQPFSQFSKILLNIVLRLQVSVKAEWLIFINILIDPNVTLLTWDDVDGIWYLKGPYAFALEQNEDVKWVYNKEKGKYVLSVLVVFSYVSSLLTYLPELF